MQEKHSRADSSVAPVEPEWPHPDDVRRELNRIINSSPFRDAHRLSSFLSFIVEMTLMGHSKKLKAYTIAVEALDRGADFDPQVDPSCGSRRFACAKRWRATIREPGATIRW